MKDLERRLDAIITEVGSLKTELKAASMCVPVDTKLVESRNIRMQPPQLHVQTSWNNQLLQFEAGARTNGWLPGKEATAMTLALRGEAQQPNKTLQQSLFYRTRKGN